MADADEMSVSTSTASSRQGSVSSSGFIRLKRIPDSEVMNCIQFGVEKTVGAIETKPERDLLIQDFMTLETIAFSSRTCVAVSQNSIIDFKFINYAPFAFKCFRGLFKIKTSNFLNSMCSGALRQLENPGASGSVFYLTHDDSFILKTAQKREAEFLLKLLPGYYLNLTQNPKTLLPKFFGFYSFSKMHKTIRIVVMNNLIPSNLCISERYDLKGSTSKRKATLAELQKPSPTYKDLDFIERHPEGLVLDYDMYSSLKRALERDCRVLESFKIIDYSLLLAVHYVNRKPNVKKFTCTRESNRDPLRAIPARTTSGEELLLFIGIIDILQSYEFRKKFEHTFKSLIYEKDSISVHRPDFYSQRFQNFIMKTAFRPTVKRKSAKIPLESEPSCSDSKLLQENPVWWPSNRKKYCKKPTPVFLSDENIKQMSQTPQSNYKRVEEEGKLEVREKSIKSDKKETTGNAVAVEIK